MNLTLPALFHDPLLIKLFAALGADHLRYVGGCVRNAVLGTQIHDIDMATTHSPQKVIDILAEYGIKTIPTGLQHGTVSVPFGQSVIEITTLRRDVATDGRHAVVSFEHDWAIDAARRDFTINAVYMDQNGKIFDLLGWGLHDLTHRRVRFIGDAATRIHEDHLRILRFFRFSLYYAHTLDPDGLLACEKFARSVLTLSKERVSGEMFKIITHDGCVNILKMMQNTRILPMLYARSTDWPQILNRLIDLQRAELQGDESQNQAKTHPAADIILCQRIVALCGPRKCLPKNSGKILPISAHLSLSRAQSTLIKKFAKLVTSKKKWALFDFNLLRHENGEDFARAAAMTLHAHGKIEATELQKWQNFQINDPHFTPPFKAKDYMAKGLHGAQLGKAIKSATRRWLMEYSK